MIGTYFYALDTGIFTGAQQWAPSADYPTTVPAGCGAWVDDEGAGVDGKRVDLTTDPLALVDYTAPPPPPPALADLQAAAVATLVDQISSIEDGQVRPLRELVLALAAGQAVPADDLAALQAQNDTIVALRTGIGQATAAASPDELQAVLVALPAPAAVAAVDDTSDVDPAPIAPAPDAPVDAAAPSP